MSKIKAVIFDAGGVLHKNNSAIMEDLVSELSLSEEKLNRIWAEQIPLLGSGEIDESEFWKQISEKYDSRHVSVNENLLGRTFAEQLVPFTEVRIIIKDLNKRNIKTAVLSNTIEPHAKVLKKAGLYDDFDAVLLSHEIGFRKPHKNSYEHALKILEVKANQAILIDDSPKNIQAAESIGIHSIIFTNPSQLRKDLEELIPNLYKTPPRPK